MTREEAFGHIQAAVAETVPRAQPVTDESVDLVGDGLLDSLDTMNFLFKLETRLGAKLPSIDEDYSDYRVSALIDVIQKDVA